VGIKVIVAPRDDASLDKERERVINYATTHGWRYTGYDSKGGTSWDDLLRELAGILQTTDDCIEVLEIDAHGSPDSINGITGSTAYDFGEKLQKLNRFCKNCRIYLSGCNTALRDFPSPVPQIIANATGCTVYGTVGYMSGTYCEGTARTSEETTLHPDDPKRKRHCSPYPGSKKAKGDDCFKPFTKGTP
jgi:hypothetical protein